MLVAPVLFTVKTKLSVALLLKNAVKLPLSVHVIVAALLLQFHVPAPLVFPAETNVVVAGSGIETVIGPVTVPKKDEFDTTAV